MHLKLDAMASMERIGKITDEMRINRVIKLANLERYKECSKHADWVLENFTRLKIKAKRRAKATILDTLKTPPFFNALSDPVPASHEIRFTESFETLICLSSLTQVKSFWYQEETATSFREQFMKRGDPTDPRNRSLLKELLGQVMVTTEIGDIIYDIWVNSPTNKNGKNPEDIYPEDKGIPTKGPDFIHPIPNTPA